jgi:hypothetical protein
MTESIFENVKFLLAIAIISCIIGIITIFSDSETKQYYMFGLSLVFCSLIARKSENKNITKLSSIFLIMAFMVLTCDLLYRLI